MRRRTVCTMGAFLCLCMFLSLSMQASSLADIDDGGAVGRSAGVTPPLRVSRQSLRQRGHHDAGARDDLACDELAGSKKRRLYLRGGRGGVRRRQRMAGLDEARGGGACT